MTLSNRDAGLPFRRRPVRGGIGPFALPEARTVFHVGDARNVPTPRALGEDLLERRAADRAGAWVRLMDIEAVELVVLHKEVSVPCEPVVEPRGRSLDGEREECVPVEGKGVRKYARLGALDVEREIVDDVRRVVLVEQ